jgi:hypothetical protein
MLQTFVNVVLLAYKLMNLTKENHQVLKMHF